jgi:hypothetical protein
MFLTYFVLVGFFAIFMVIQDVDNGDPKFVGLMSLLWPLILASVLLQEFSKVTGKLALKLEKFCHWIVARTLPTKERNQ